jgi:hypothetical protein
MCISYRIGGPSMRKEDVKEVLLQVLELQLDYQLRAIRQLQGKHEAETVLVHRRSRKRQSLVDLSVQILTEKRVAPPSKACNPGDSLAYAGCIIGYPTCQPL